ncbi:MAG: class I SAM-dependent methyltransferase, partial [Actinomycetota bacterium]
PLAVMAYFGLEATGEMAMAAGGTGTAAGNADMAAAWDGAEGDHWAEHAARYEAASSTYVHRLLDAIDVDARSAVLDVGCGTGGTTLAVGKRAVEGAVLGVDLSSRMLGVGRANAAAAGLDHVRFEQADAQVHPFEPASFDLAISSFGAMFFADPVAAFANIRGALRPQGGIAFQAWRELGRNEWISAIRDALAAGRDLPIPQPGVPGPFGMADRDLTTERLVAAGFDEVEFTAVDEPMWFGRDTDDAYSFVSTLGITRGLTADLDDSVRTGTLEELRAVLERHATPDGVRFAGSAWLITARTSP